MLPPSGIYGTMSTFLPSNASQIVSWSDTEKGYLQQIAHMLGDILECQETKETQRIIVCLPSFLPDEPTTSVWEVAASVWAKINLLAPDKSFDALCDRHVLDDLFINFQQTKALYAIAQKSC